MMFLKFNMIVMALLIFLIRTPKIVSRIYNTNLNIPEVEQRFYDGNLINF